MSNSGDDPSPRAPPVAKRKKEFIIEFGQALHVGIPISASESSQSHDSPKISPKRTLPDAKASNSSILSRSFQSLHNQSNSPLSESSKSLGTHKMEHVDSHSSHSLSKSPVTHSHHDLASASMVTSSSTTSPSSTSSFRREPMSTSPTESVRSHHMDAKDARASTSATSSSSHLPSGLADASLSSRALSSDSPQTMKKKRLIISVGNSKIGSIYFGKKEKKNRKTQPHTISYEYLTVMRIDCRLTNCRFRPLSHL